MLIITLAANGEPSEHVLGCMGCERIAPVTDYHLISAGADGDAVVTTLPAYSRWTEPAYALLTRLVSRHPRTHGVAAPWTHLRSSIFLGRSLENGRLIERLEARIVDGSLHVSLQDEFGTRQFDQPVRGAYAHPLDMLEHAARLALWQIDAEPPTPPPLTDVPIRDDGAEPYVLAADIPPFPRRHFEQRRLGCTVPTEGAYSAEDWWQFIGGLP